MKTTDATSYEHDNVEETINDIFDHHGWNIAGLDERGISPYVITTIHPFRFRAKRWRGMSSRGNPLFIGSPYWH